MYASSGYTKRRKKKFQRESISRERNFLISCLIVSTLRLIGTQDPRKWIYVNRRCFSTLLLESVGMAYNIGMVVLIISEY
jgi:hypothetical protein